MSGRTLAGLIVVLVLGLSATPADAQVTPYATGDYGGIRNILPPGTNGLDNAAQLAAFEATGVRPAHNQDQLGMYANLIKVAPHVTAANLPELYKDATFGVPSGQAQSSESPEPGVTIVRDSAFGVPHIYGDTRSALMFGIGYATGEDRLFFIDVLRHYGTGTLASFAGGANASMDAGQFLIAPYTRQDLQAQLDYDRAHLPDGQQIYQDATDYVAGINAYISAAQLDPTLMPGEYAAIGQPTGPAPFRVTDLISIASLVGGIFGKGGGFELPNAMLEQGLAQRFGLERLSVPGAPEGPSAAGAAAVRGASLARKLPRRAHHRSPGLRHRRRHRTRGAVDTSGYAAFLDFARPDDPEAPTTAPGSFPYRTLPAQTAPGSLAMPDPGSVHMVDPIVGGGQPASTKSSPGALAGLLAFPRSQSNALLVSGAHTASGHPIAVMGPQVAYFAPEILMEQDIHGPGIDAEGAAFPGVNLYVELGHGPDYAWSATSAGQDIIDTFALPLCDPSGAAPSTASNGYLYDGVCTPMETISQTESWTPNLADQTPAGSQTLSIQRTKLGLVIARATVGGRPVAYTSLRATYMHELDSAQGFEQYNEPAMMRNPQQFMNAANQIAYTFNWFYIDDRHIAYFNSGANPVRAPGTNPLFPVWGTHPWANWNPADATFAAEPQSAHPQAVDPAYLTSWNNKQAHGYQSGDTAQQYSSIYRSQLLDQGIAPLLSAGRKMTLPDLVNAMGTAATQDLRGLTVLPFLLDLIGPHPDPAVAGAVATLRTWMTRGAHRIDTTGSGHYDDAEAVQLMDAWWPLLVQAEFTPTLGSSLLSEAESEFPINDEPGHGTSGEHLGSSWDVGFYGLVQKDLRSVLGQPVAGALSRRYCGQGVLGACRAALQSTLHEALGESAAQVYPADGQCAAGDQECSDSIRFRPLGAVTQPLIPWQNRPTFQQVVEIPGHGPRN